MCLLLVLLDVSMAIRASPLAVCETEELFADALERSVLALGGLLCVERNPLEGRAELLNRVGVYTQPWVLGGQVAQVPVATLTRHAAPAAT